MYKIVCNDLNIKDLYVGHTTDFKRRKSEHKKKAVNTNYHFKIYETIKANGGWENWSMIEIEKYPCNDSKEATARERYWFEILQANLNTYFPQRTSKEYYDATKQYQLKYQKDYALKNKDNINTKRNKPIICVCGGCYTVRNQSRHFKFIKHIKFIEEQNI
jgi:hypothetical protein